MKIKAVLLLIVLITVGNCTSIMAYAGAEYIDGLPYIIEENLEDEESQYNGYLISNANMRAEPSITGKHIDSFKANTELKVLNKINDWYEVYIEAHSHGYIYAKLVSTTFDCGEVDYSELELLSTYTTYFSSSDKNRNHNMEYACIKNTMKLNPGETFSFNNNCNTKEDDINYKLAGVIVNKKLVKGLGGGICQPSSTIYNAVLQVKGLEIIERHGHSLSVGYVPKGKDATVNRGTADLKFKNNLEYPVYIYCDCNLLNGSLTASIYK